MQAFHRPIVPGLTRCRPCKDTLNMILGDKIDEVFLAIDRDAALAIDLAYLHMASLLTPSF